MKIEKLYKINKISLLLLILAFVLLIFYLFLGNNLIMIIISYISVLILSVIYGLSRKENK